MHFFKISNLFLPITFHELIQMQILLGVRNAFCGYMWIRTTYILNQSRLPSTAFVNRYFVGVAREAKGQIRLCE